jgi:signal transduction histidine kinase
MTDHDSGMKHIHQALQALRRGDFNYRLDHTDLPDDVIAAFEDINSYLGNLTQEIVTACQSIGIDQNTESETPWDDLARQVRDIVTYNQTMQSELIQISAEAGRVQSSLAERRRQLYMVISSMPNMLIILDHENRIKSLFIPPGFPLSLRGDLLDTEHPMWEILPARLAEEIEGALWSLRKSNQTTSFEYAEDNEDQTLYFEIKTSPVIDSTDNLVVINNITERRRQERRLMQMKDDFVSYASHEIRTPIYAIKGFLDLILSGKVEDPNVRQEFLQRVANGVERLSALASDLLDSSRIQSGQMRVSCQTMDIRDMVQEVVDSLQALAHIKELEIVYRQPPNPLMVSGDKLRLHQVMINLLQNAMHYSQPGQKVNVGATNAEGGVLVTVTDQGMGIPAQDIPRVFDKFFRVDSEANRATTGSGLGLYISRSIIDLHGGQIGVNSEPGKGSTFYFMLPYSRQT